MCTIFNFQQFHTTRSRRQPVDNDGMFYRQNTYAMFCEPLLALQPIPKATYTGISYL